MVVYVDQVDFDRLWLAVFANNFLLSLLNPSWLKLSSVNRPTSPYLFARVPLGFLNLLPEIQ